MSPFNEYQGAYCRNCGQRCQPEAWGRPREDYDPPGTAAFLPDWRSPCCHDELSEDPVSERCDGCGATVDCSVPDREMDRFSLADGNLYCPSCLADYRADHPDWEELVEAAARLADSREDRE